MVPKDNSRRKNKLESAHHSGVFVGVVPRTGEVIVLTPEGAIPVRTVHRLSEDKRWDVEFINKVKGAPWDFKATAGDGIAEGVIPERPDQPPDVQGPPEEQPARINVRRMYIRKVDVEKHGPTT